MPHTSSSPGAGDPYSSWGLTFVLGSEFAHLSWESLVELVLSRDQGLAQGRLVEAEHTGVPPNLVDKGLQQDALGAGLPVHGSEGWAHPPGAGRKEKGEAEGVLRPARPPSAVCPRVRLYGLGSSAARARTLCQKQTVTGVGISLEPKHSFNKRQTD